MKHEDTRERLDNKKIASYYAEQQLQNPYPWVAFGIYSLVTFVIWSMYSHENSTTLALKIIVYGILVLQLLLILLIFFLIWDYIQLRKGNFRVISAPLIKSFEFDDNPYDHKEGPRLEFGKHGYYLLPSLPLYQKSPYYRTTAKELLDRACNGDEFYLIKRHKRWIYIAFPTRCFLWDGEIHKR